MGSVAARKLNKKETNSDEKNHKRNDYDTRIKINEKNYSMINNKNYSMINNNHDSNNNDNDYSKMDNKIVRIIAILRFTVIILIILITVICFYSLCE